MTTLPAPTRMYQALVEKDASYEGVFIAGVTSTGIFCRPTCPARKPKAENVEYFATVGEALRAGYRPCKRCRPLDDGEPVPAWVARLTETVEAAPTRRLTDADLQAMSIDPATARRYFKRRYGMTFHAFHRARRMGLALTQIRDGGTNGHSNPNGRTNGRRDVSAVGYDHGYESASGFRDAFARLFGTPPGQADGCTCLAARWIETPLGAMIAIAGDEGLSLLEFVDRRRLEAEVADLRRRLNAVVVPGDHPHLDLVTDELGRYFAGTLTAFTVPLRTPGSEFQRAVWRELQRIPSGTTRSYAEMAERVGRPGAHRAVGRSNGENRIAIVIPCHRVVRSDGNLCGYGGGVWRKRRLLEVEGAAAASGSRP